VAASKKLLQTWVEKPIAVLLKRQARAEGISEAALIRRLVAQGLGVDLQGKEIPCSTATSRGSE